MRVHIILGFSDPRHHSDPVVVYAGHDGSAARKAMAQSPSPFFLVIQNPTGLRKINPSAAANAKADEVGDADAAVIEVSAAELKQYQDEMKRLQQVAADRSVEIESLTSRVKTLDESLASALAAARPVAVEVAPAAAAEQPDSATAATSEPAKPAASRRR